MNRRWIRHLAVLVALVTALTLLGVGGASTASADRTFGHDPLDNVLYWADQHKKCGLSRDKLAAIMLAPTFPETGAPPGQAPSPMTMGRWDNQSGLYSFGNTTSYVDAFWHAGIGVFAFDSAGGWGMTAAERINTVASADRAASVMANRWCANQSLSYVWAPWFGCNGGTCQAIYNEIYRNGRLTNVDRDLTVTSLGGMEVRSCTLEGPQVTVTCSYVDADRAQGYAGFAVPWFGPSPISAPFYVAKHGGREYRVWLKQDTGYNIDITASRPLGSNARTSLTWSAGKGLCDHTTGAGVCSFEFSFGKSTDTPLVGDWNGDGVDTPGVHRGRTFYLTNTTGNPTAEIVVTYGVAGDTPVVGDWNGDGRDTIGVRRGRAYYLRNRLRSGNADITFAYGRSGDQPVTGDWNGDGVDTAGVRRGNRYYLRNKHAGGVADLTFAYGRSSDVPVTADWDLDGDDTAGVFRPNEGRFYLANRNGVTVADVMFDLGGAGDTPLGGRWAQLASAGVGVVDGNRWHLVHLG